MAFVTIASCLFLHPTSAHADEKTRGEVRVEAALNAVDANDGSDGSGGQGRLIVVPRTSQGPREQINVGAGYTGGQYVGELGFWEGRGRRAVDGPGVSVAKGLSVEASPQLGQATAGFGILIPIQNTILELDPRLPYTSVFYLRKDDLLTTSWGGLKATIEQFLSPSHPVSMRLWAHADAITNGSQTGLASDGSLKSQGTGISAGGGFGIRAMLFNSPLYLIADVDTEVATIKTVDAQAVQHDAGFAEFSTHLGLGVVK